MKNSDYTYMTIAVPKDDTFSYAMLHALARAHGLTLGLFIRQAIETRYAAEIAAHSQFANSVAHLDQLVHESSGDHA